MEKNILSHKLKEYRSQKGLTQQQLAEKLDVSDKSISKWELGGGYPSKRNLIKISKQLNVSLEVLLIEQQQDDNKKLKLSVKYGVISYVLIFAITLIVDSFRSDLSFLLQQDISEILKALGQRSMNYNLISLPPALIIGFVFYFYIFPKEARE